MSGDKIIKQKKLSVRIGKLALCSPLIAASGTFGYAEELEGLVDFKYFGAITTKTITLRPRTGNPPPRLVETPYGLLNSIGLDNPGIDVFLEQKWPYLSSLKIAIIVSIGGETEDEFVDLARRLGKLANLKAIEINISCPNIKSQVTSHPSIALRTGRSQVQNLRPATCDMRQLIAQDPKATFDVVKAVRKATKKTLIVKLTPNVTDISEIALAAEKAGADCLSLVNTYFGLTVDVNKRRPILANITGGLSGPAIKPLSLYAVYKTYREVKIPIIAGGGIMNAKDAIEFLICGATALSLGTVNFINPNAAVEILQGLARYLKKYKIKRLRSITGSLITR